MAIVILLIPFLGTTFGSACVFFLKKSLSFNIQKYLIGFAGGVMVGACFWSLLLPAIEVSISKAFIGYWLGTLFLLFIDQLIPHLHQFANQPEGLPIHFNKITMMLLAVTIHNIPEGMAVGVVYAGWLLNNQAISFSGVLSLTLGIAIQNFPEGAIISLPLHASEKVSKTKAFLYGTLSGAVEPLGALLTLYFASFTNTLLPYFLSFASGAMMYVVIEELIPEFSSGKHSNIATVYFSIGFTLMMILDCLL